MNLLLGTHDVMSTYDIITFFEDNGHKVQTARAMKQIRFCLREHDTPHVVGMDLNMDFPGEVRVDSALEIYRSLPKGIPFFGYSFLPETVALGQENGLPNCFKKGDLAGMETYFRTLFTQAN